MNVRLRNVDSNGRTLGPCQARQCGLQGFRAFLQALAFLVRHVGFQDLDDAATAHDTRQRQCHPKPVLQTANWDYGVLIVEHNFGDARRYDSDAVLAGVMALDDGDVGVANFLFELISECVDSCAAPLQKC